MEILYTIIKYIIIYFVINLFLKVIFIVGDFIDNTKNKNRTVFHFTARYNFFVILIGIVALLFFGGCTYFCWMDCVAGKEDFSTVFVFLFFDMLILLYLLAFSVSVRFKEFHIIYTNMFGFKKKYLIEELEFVSYKNDLRAYKEGKKAFSFPATIFCTNSYGVFQTLQGNSNYIDIDCFSKSELKKKGWLDKPYIQRLLNYNKIQEPKEIRIMQYVGSVPVLGFAILILYSGMHRVEIEQNIAALIMGLFFCGIGMYLLNEATKKITLYEDEFEISRFWIFKKIYKYSDIGNVEVKTVDGFNPQTGGKRRVFIIRSKSNWPLIKFTEMSSNIREISAKTFRERGKIWKE